MDAKWWGSWHYLIYELNGPFFIDRHVQCSQSRRISIRRAQFVEKDFRKLRKLFKLESMFTDGTERTLIAERTSVDPLLFIDATKLHKTHFLKRHLIKFSCNCSFIFLASTSAELSSQLQEQDEVSLSILEIHLLNDFSFYLFKLFLLRRSSIYLLVQIMLRTTECREISLNSS